MERKKSLWERLTGTINTEEEEDFGEEKKISLKTQKGGRDKKDNNWIEEENEEAELAVDVYQTPTDIVVQTFVAGVKPEDLELSIARDVITVKGQREDFRTIDDENYFSRELYWGKFSRTISLPAEVEPEEVEATEKHGLLTIKIRKVDKAKKNNVRVKSI